MTHNQRVVCVIKIRSVVVVVVFMEHLYVPRNELSTYIVSLSLAVTLLSRYYHSCFIDEEKESQISNLSKSY